MSPEKALLLLLALIATVWGAPSSSASYDLVVGTRQTGDRSVFRENITLAYSWTGLLTMEKALNTTDKVIITQVKCLNQVTDGTGAYPMLFGGGPGFTWVLLSFQSQWWRGIYFIVEVFAKPS